MHKQIVLLHELARFGGDKITKGARDWEKISAAMQITNFSAVLKSYEYSVKKNRNCLQKR